MSIRHGYSVGRTTTESSLSDQLKRFKIKSLIIPEEEKKIDPRRLPNPSHESLRSKCLKVVVNNFEKLPVKDIIPSNVMNDIINLLPTTISPIISCLYIYNENYWKKCCIEKYGWHNCQLQEHGFLWKQMYFEKLLQEKLEYFDINTDNIDDFYDFIDACMDYIFTLTLKQLPSHIDISDICISLPNLTKIDITYGINKIGMNYDRILFGMKISDAISLAKTFDRVDTLTTVILSGNMIDDDLLRMLMTGLIKNNSIIYLDLSHNKITNHGARLLAKLLGENSVLTTLNLADNQIHTEGGRYLARGLTENDSLLNLNLRLNRFADEGCSLLLEGLQSNFTLKDLNISSNGAGQQASRVLNAILRDPQHNLEALDISGNDFDGEHFNLMRLALMSNKSLKRVDLRRNPGYREATAAIVEIEKIVHNNEIIAKPLT